MTKPLKYSLILLVFALMGTYQWWAPSLGLVEVETEIPDVDVDQIIEDSLKTISEILQDKRDDLSKEDSIWSWNGQTYDYDFVGLYNPAIHAKNAIDSLAERNPDSRPIKTNWKELTSVNYIKKYYEEFYMDILTPVFPDSLKRLNGRIVEIKGYVIPFDQTGNALALSASPFAACFFCGKGSPASVMSLYPKNKKRSYQMDEHLSFTGRLRLNYDNPDEFYYILETAEEL